MYSSVIQQLSFPQKCLLVCLVTGRVKTILHRKRLSLILNQTHSLRHILTAHNEAAFWIPRRDADRKRFKREQRERLRTHRAMSAPCWTGEPRPKGALTVALEKLLPAPFDFTQLKEISWELEEPGLYPRLSQPYFRYQRPSRFVFEPSAPPPKTVNDEGFTAKQVTRVIGKHRWADPTSSAVFEIVYEGRKVRDVAAERGLAAKRVSHYVWMVRADLRDVAATPEAVTADATNCSSNSSISSPVIEKTVNRAPIQIFLGRRAPK